MYLFNKKLSNMLCLENDYLRVNFFIMNGLYNNHFMDEILIVFSFSYEKNNLF
jgi:hypothetical protein